MEFVQVGNGRCQKLQMAVANHPGGIGVPVRDIGTVADPRGGGMLGVIGLEFIGHAADFVGQGGGLGQARHRFDGQPLDPLLVRMVHQFLHVPQIAGHAPRFGFHAVAIHGAGIGASRAGPHQGGDLDQPAVAPQGRRLPSGIAREKAPQLAVRREHAFDAYPVRFGLLAEAKEILVGQLIDLEKTAQLHQADTLLGQQPEEPVIRVPVFDRIGLDAEFEFERWQRGSSGGNPGRLAARYTNLQRNGPAPASSHGTPKGQAPLKSNDWDVRGELGGPASYPDGALSAGTSGPKATYLPAAQRIPRCTSSRKWGLAYALLSCPSMR